MLLIDHQSGLFETVGDVPIPVLRNHAAALATMAAPTKMLVITTALVPLAAERPAHSRDPSQCPACHICGAQG